MTRSSGDNASHAQGTRRSISRLSDESPVIAMADALDVLIVIGPFIEIAVT